MGASRERSAAPGSKERSRRDARAGASPTRSLQGGALDGIGNRALLALMRSGRLQAKTRSGRPDDPREAEADRAAEGVVAGEAPAPASTPGRPLAGGAGEDPSAHARDLLGRLHGGRRLDEATRATM